MRGEYRPDAQAAECADDGFSGDAGRRCLRKGRFEGAGDDAFGGGAFFLAPLAHRGVLLRDGLELEPNPLCPQGKAETLGRARGKFDLVAQDRAEFRVVMLHDVEQHPIQQAGEGRAIAGLCPVPRHRCVHQAARDFLSNKAATVDPNSPALGATVRPYDDMISAFSVALSPTPEMMAPAWPMRRPFGAVRPAT